MNTDSEDHSQREESDTDEDDLSGLIPVIQDKLVEIVSEKLNLSVYEVQSQLAEGNKLWQITYDQGLSLQESEMILIDARKEALKQAVRQGDLKLHQVRPLEMHMHRRLEMELQRA